MPIASFRGKVFQVSSNRKYTFSGLEWNSSLETEAQEKLKDKPSTYIKGESLNTMTFEIPLRADFGIDVRLEIESWEAIKSSTKPDIFILGTKPLGKNKWLLKSVAVSNVEIDNTGRILRAMLKLDFEEYIRAGKAQSNNSSLANASSSGLNLPPSNYIYDPPNKAEEKRNNPNVMMARRNERED
jgi:hypothetical protein